jgi:hypothetical protein
VLGRAALSAYLQIHFAHHGVTTTRAAAGRMHRWAAWWAAARVAVRTGTERGCARRFASIASRALSPRGRTRARPRMRASASSMPQTSLAWIMIAHAVRRPPCLPPGNTDCPDPKLSSRPNKARSPCTPWPLSMGAPACRAADRLPHDLACAASATSRCNPHGLMSERDKCRVRCGRRHR